MYPDDPAAVSAIHSSVECLQSEDISAAVQCNTILQYNNTMNTTHMAPGALRAELPPAHDGARHPHQAHTAEVLSF